MWLWARRILIDNAVGIGMGPFFAVLLGRYIVQNPEQHLTNEVQPKSIRTLKIPDFYSEYREKGEGYAAFLGSSIIAKVGFVYELLEPMFFFDDGCASISALEGDLSRVAKQKLREQSRVWRERPVGDHRNVSGTAVTLLVEMGRGPPSDARVFMTDSLENVISLRDPPGRCQPRDCGLTLSPRLR